MRGEFHLDSIVVVPVMIDSNTLLLLLFVVGLYVALQWYNRVRQQRQQRQTVDFLTNAAAAASALQSPEFMEYANKAVMDPRIVAALQSPEAQAFRLDLEQMGLSFPAATLSVSTESTEATEATEPTDRAPHIKSA